MMKTFISIFFALIFTLCIVAGCKPKHNDAITGGGKGGTSIINASGEHHGSLLDTCMIYIKYGTLDAPANGIYDDSMACSILNGTPGVAFSGLTVGNYYLLAVGFHGGFSPPTVRGAFPYTISQAGSTANIVIPTGQYYP